jgi:hypothetical protein
MPPVPAPVVTPPAPTTPGISGTNFGANGVFNYGTVNTPSGPMVFNNALGGPVWSNIGAPHIAPGYQGGPSNTGPFYPM